MAGTEGAKIPPHTERPKALKHNEIIDRFTPVNGDPAFDAVAVYWQAKTDWTIGLETFRTRMNTAIAQAWEGNAAEASKTAINTYTTKADSLTGTFETVARLISDSVLAASNTKTSLPPRKDDPDIWDINDRWINNDEFERGRDDDEEEAQAIMAAAYVTPFETIDNGLPVLDHPTSLIDDTFVPTGGGDDDDDTGGGGKPNQNTDDPDDTTGDDETPQDPTDDEGDEDETSDDTTDDDDTDDGDDTSDDDTTDDGDDDTDPASTQPAGTTPATTPDTKPTTPNSPGSPSSPGGGTPAGGTPGTTLNPGRVTPGMPTSVTPATVAGVTAASATGGRGMSSPGMMGGAGAGRGKDDESTHEIPDYLINEQNTRELLGEIAKATPQALGSRFLAAQTKPVEPEGGPQ
ncbi:hypothetical protein [Nocardia sp. AG03]|uniref:hypothetical protein n=1 Tax=Nocardia sp. AG03 TaxID=3025312 RepID=UPI0024187596|nr:hypothetical protein [Nocardia sp. AG03]